jgi:hypothetical protein
MKSKFPPAVPEIPVSDVGRAVAYYQCKLGFTLDWGVFYELATAERAG